ncbi:MAG: hypothetical protein ACNS60_19410 [Candidatus Cyclobacteriaceae bacterium M2_1C_046]
MWRYKLVGVALFLKAFFGKLDFEAQRLDFTQGKKYYTIENLGTIHAPEISGITAYQGNLYFLVDSGGEPELYLLNKNLQIQDTISVGSTSNIDWEALTVDEQDNFYIGDIGNNLNQRKNLRIYKFNKELSSLDTIHITYAQQEHFPPPKEKMNFDSEALFWQDNKLHLFSKNRGRKCVKHYILPDTIGEYNLIPTEEIRLNGMITGADISPDGSLVALLSYGKIYIFKREGEKLYENPYLLIETTRFGQSEALAFISDNEMIVSNEAGKFFKVILDFRYKM